MNDRHRSCILLFIFQLEEIVRKETLDEENISSTFNLEDVSDSEEIWIMDIPRLVSPGSGRLDQSHNHQLT